MLMPLLRDAQSHFPFLRPLKFSAYNTATRVLGWRIDPEFKVLDRIGEVRLAIDVGANWGQSIYALKRTARPHRIVSFEPNRLLASRLTKKFIGDPGVQIESFALSDRAGSFRLYIPRYRKFVYDGLSSLDYESAHGFLNAERVAKFDSSKLFIEEAVVEVRTLDSYNFEPQVVKIDVQGVELAVVKGGMHMFRRYQPATIVETPSTELCELFGEFGMTPWVVTVGGLSEYRGYSVNVLFLGATHRKALGI